jgi:hypothetical protein
VSAFGEFLAELGANDATTAVGRVNRDADVHWYFEPGTLCFVKVPSSKYQVQLAKKVEAGDPRYRPPLSQLDSPSERGQVRAGVYACFKFLAMIPATPPQLFHKKALAD